MTSRKRLNRGFAFLGGGLAAAAVSVGLALFVPVPPQYEPFFFPAVFLVSAVFFCVLFMRLTKTMWKL